MKNKKLVFFLSAIIPIIIFLIGMIINHIYPFGNKIINVYDSKDQYSSILIALIRNIKSFNLFYSMNAGLGLNMYGISSYYGTGILNIFALFINAVNYPLYSTIMILLRFACLGLSMCFYLSKKNLKPIFIIMLSVSYSLMGFTATYYYNFIWIDSIILLPLVIYGLDKLIDEDKPLLYIISLSLAIISNFYIGYMICIFCLLYFLYKLFIYLEKKKEKIKTFIISSILAVLISAFVLIPAFFALKTGKTVIYNHNINYLGFDKNILNLFYSLTPGSYIRGDHFHGPAIIYSGIFVFVNVVLFFFNQGITKKEKTLTLIFIIIFVLSIFLNIFIYTWHMFAHPIWFIFRFTFVISFFLILIASRNLEYINKLRLTTNKKILLSTIFIILIELSALYKFKFNLSRELENTYLGYFLIYSMTIFIIYIFNINKKTHLIYTLFFLLFLIDISINTINTQYNNTYDAANVNIKLSKKYNKIINSIKSKDNSFYRITIKKNKVDELLNAGLSYDYYEIDHMSSIRNNNINRFLTSTGLNGLSDYAIITFENYDDSILNLYGIKYIINDDGSKYSTINNNLGLGFTVSENTKNIKLAPNNFYGDNLNRLYSSFINMNSSFYELINYKDFMIYDNKYEKKATYNFVADDNYIIHTGNVIYNLEIDNKKYSYKDKGTSFTVNKGERIKITYKFDDSINKKNIHLILFNLDKYDQVIRKLNNTTDKLYNIKINKNNHIISGEIDVKGDYKYLFTTIGYEKGMKIYVDGKNIEPDLISDAVIGLKLTKGHHEIIIDYIPKGLVIGLITTLFGIVGTLYIIKRKKS